MNEPLLQVEGLQKLFPVRGGVFGRVTGQVRAVESVSLSINAGETYALVGESGCGKSTTGQTILRLTEPSAGSIRFEGREIRTMSGEQLREVRRHMQIVFQDPYSALNPRKTVENALLEVVRFHDVAHGEEARAHVHRVLEQCGLSPYHARRYPHEFSGGQRQRVVIARALVLHPRFIVADEPVSALDVSIQSQIINLLKQLQRSMSLTYLFISHDLAVVKHMADRVGVMYLGSIVEEAPKAALYGSPQHPYTKALLSAIPKSDPTVVKERIVLRGDVPSPANPPAGCPFHTRCPLAQEICRRVKPDLKRFADGHSVACHLVEAR